MIYALKAKGRLEFTCASDTQEGHKQKVTSAYWNWKGTQPRDSKASLKDYLAKYDRVTLVIEPQTEKESEDEG